MSVSRSSFVFANTTHLPTDVLQRDAVVVASRCFVSAVGVPEDYNDWSRLNIRFPGYTTVIYRYLVIDTFRDHRDRRNHERRHCRRVRNCSITCNMQSLLKKVLPILTIMYCCFVGQHRFSQGLSHAKPTLQVLHPPPEAGEFMVSRNRSTASLSVKGKSVHFVGPEFKKDSKSPGLDSHRLAFSIRNRLSAKVVTCSVGALIRGSNASNIAIVVGLSGALAVSPGIPTFSSSSSGPSSQGITLQPIREGSIVVVALPKFMTTFSPKLSSGSRS